MRLRRREKVASAPIANSATIGGSGTWVPELVLVLVELLVDELVDDDELVELLVDVLEVMLPEVEVLVDTLPEVELELPPVLVEVEVELPLTLMIVPLLPDDEPLVVVVELISTWPPPLDPPKKPPTKPPP